MIKTYICYLWDEVIEGTEEEIAKCDRILAHSFRQAAKEYALQIEIENGIAQICWDDEENMIVVINEKTREQRMFHAELVIDHKMTDVSDDYS